MWKDSRYSPYKTDCQHTLNGLSWSHVPGQEPCQELDQTLTSLIYEIYQGSELATTLSVLLSGGMVHLPTFCHRNEKLTNIYLLL